MKISPILGFEFPKQKTCALCKSLLRLCQSNSCWFSKVVPWGWSAWKFSNNTVSSFQCWPPYQHFLIFQTQLRDRQTRINPKFLISTLWKFLRSALLGRFLHWGKSPTRRVLQHFSSYLEQWTWTIWVWTNLYQQKKLWWALRCTFEVPFCIYQRLEFSDSLQWKFQRFV